MARTKHFVPSRVVDHLTEQAIGNDLIRADSADDFGNEEFSSYIKEELEQVTGRVMEANKPPLSALEVLPIDQSVAEGAEAYLDKYYDGTGQPQTIEEFGGDLPLVEVHTGQDSRALFHFGLAWEYTVQDLARQQLSGEPLNTRKGVRTRDQMLRHHNRIAWLGEESKGVHGILTHPEIPRQKLGIDFSDVKNDADEISEAMKAAVSAIVNDTDGAEVPDTLLMSLKAYNKLTARIGDTTTTVLDFFLDTNQFISTVRPVAELNGRKDSDPNQFFVMSSGSESVRYVAPAVFRTVPPQTTNLATRINAYAITGGVAVQRPRANRLVTIEA